MKRRIRWTKVPAKTVPRDRLGQVVRAYRHTTGAMLVHRKPTSRNSSFYRRVGVWVLTMEGHEISTSWYYDRPALIAPLRAATAALRKHLGGHYGRLCGYSPPYPKQEPTGVGNIGCWASSATTSVSAQAAGPTPRTGIPARPLGGLLMGCFAEQVLFRDEFDLYLSEWHRWAKLHPQLVRNEYSRVMLDHLCQSTVLGYRSLRAMAVATTPKLARLHHRIFSRHQRLRTALGLTRLQRLHDA